VIFRIQFFRILKICIEQNKTQEDKGLKEKIKTPQIIDTILMEDQIKIILKFMIYDKFIFAK
jgi:hypothetical protein